jgi:hypothetical protein
LNILLSSHIKSNKNSQTEKFTQGLIDIWKIKKEDDLNIGLLPSDNIIREKIIRLMQSQGMIDNHMFIWADTTKDNLVSTINLMTDGFRDPEQFYQNYIHNGLKDTDIGLKHSYKFPNQTFRKYGTFDPDYYRSLPIYKLSRKNEKIEDVLFSSFEHPYNGVTTFFTSYKTEFDKNHYFNDNDRDKQHFILSILSLNPKFPTAVCDKNGYIYHSDESFWEYCKMEFPFYKNPLGLPSKVLADLIKWNNKTPYEVSYKNIEFKLLSYNGIYWIQSIPKKVIKIVLPSKKQISEIGLIRQKEEKPVKYSDNIKIMSEIKDNTESNIREVAENISELDLLKIENSELKFRIEELEAENSELKGENIRFSEITSKYSDSVSEAILDTAEESLTLPEVAPILFTGKQAESLDFLEEHYGQYLSHFGAEENILFQYQLKDLDDKLRISCMNRVNYLRRRGELSIKFADIVPPMSKETDQILSETPDEEILKMVSLHHSKKYRKTK